MEDKEHYYLTVDFDRYETRITPKFKMRKKYRPSDPKKITAFIPGVINEVYVKAGQQVHKGDSLFILEAMKMKNVVKAAIDGTIKQIHIKQGDMVPKDALLVEFH